MTDEAGEAKPGSAWPALFLAPWPFLQPGSQAELVEA